MRTIGLTIALLLLAGCWQSELFLLSITDASRLIPEGTYADAATGENMTVTLDSDGSYRVGEKRVVFNSYGVSHGMPGFAYAAQDGDNYAYGVVFLDGNGDLHQVKPDCGLPPYDDIARRAGASSSSDGSVCWFDSAASLREALQEVWRRGPDAGSTTQRRVSTQAPATQSLQSVYLDYSGNEVSYAVQGSYAEFSAVLPEGWAFDVSVDGNQDGAWGGGGDYATSDRSYSHGRNGFCAQYIIEASAGNPDYVSTSSACGAFRSAGSGWKGDPDSSGRRRTTMRIPLAELFAGQSSAHLQVCLWDGQKNICQGSPASPYVVTKP